ncbi:MAG TPA: type II secretion system protein N [Steroidobacteraceae bacterium]|nr:type II secretion system protein N [Steroidobacteraceae bacterium]
MSLRSALLLAILVFVATLLVRLPASVLMPLLPAGIGCEMPGGTLWQGSCARLRYGSLSLSGFSWKLHPAALLRLRVSAELSSEDPRARGHTQVELTRDGGIHLQALSAQLPLQGGLRLFPQGLAGTLQIAVQDARLRHDQLLALQGSIRVLQLRSEDEPADLGNFELQFPAAAGTGPIEGQLHDLGGPLSVSGQLRLLRGGGYDLSGWVAARPQASPDLIQALQLLGPPDAQGRRMFSLAGSL